MKYFQSLPTILNTDYSGNQIIVKNLLTRLSIIPSILKSPMVYYEYDIQEGDTPEIISYKYYGTPDNFWAVLFANQMIDPQWDWPLSGTAFDSYIIDKYGSTAIAQSQVDHYTKTITTKDDSTGTVTSEIIVIDEDEYNNFVPYNDITYNLPNGYSVTVSGDVSIVSSYVNELTKNESKRSIRILDAQFISNLENQFKQLVANG